MTLTLSEIEVRGAMGTDPRDLVTSEQFNQMVDDVVDFEKVTRPYAEDGVAQFLVFLKAWGDAMEAVGGDASKWAKFAPSPAVDKIWHRTMMRTRLFATVCDQVAGRYMHHVPIMDEDIQSGKATQRALEAMLATGYRVDLPWWTDGESCCPENCGTIGD